MAVYEDVIGGWTDDAGYKPPARLATTVSLGTSATGLLVIDGVQTVAGDRVLRWQESDQTQNGVWVVNSGAWTRAIDWGSSSAILFGTQVYISSGATYGNSVFICQTQMPVVGTTPITFLRFTTTSQINPTRVPQRKIVAGTTDIASASDGMILWQSAAGGLKTQNLPAAASLGSGQSITIVESYGDGGINNINVVASGADTINGNSTFLMNSIRQSTTFTSDGISAWVVG